VDVVSLIHWQVRPNSNTMAAMVDGEAQIRPATLDDVPAIRNLLTAHRDDGPPTTVDIVGPYLGHLIEHATALVSERPGETLAFGAAVNTGVSRHLADLFVRPDVLGQGIGRPLLEAALEDTFPRTTFASADPRALPLYVRAGMTPLWPCLYLEGSPDGLPAPEPGITITAAAPDNLSDLEREWTGADRPIDHAFWASQTDAEPFAVFEGGRPVALGYARARQASPARVIDRMVVRPGSDPIEPVLAAIRLGARGSAIVVCLLGPHPVLPILLQARFRIIDRDQFMAYDPALVDPIRLLPNPGMF
jgi:GNAT superfamily N-acetyltransferase